MMLQEKQDKIKKISFTGRGGIGLPMFFCLYIAQSIPSSFFATALQVMMREAHSLVRCVAAALDPLMRHTDKQFSTPI